MQTRAEAIACCLQLPDVYEDYPFADKNWTVMRHGQNKKAYAWTFLNGKGISGLTSNARRAGWSFGGRNTKPLSQPIT